MNFQHIKNAYAQNIIMKTYEWMIKIISYILCCAAVCAGFSLKERGTDVTLQSYMKSSEEQKTSRLSGILIRLKDSLSRCVNSEEDKEAYAEGSFCCKAASDAVCETDGGKASEPLRLFFDRVKKVCDEIYTSDYEITLLQRQTVSELYMRLSAMEDALLSGRYGATELINRLSAGLSSPEAESVKRTDRISVNRAEKYAYELIGDGVRLKSCGMFDGHFIFASDGSCIVLSHKGAPLIKSRTTTDGAEHMDAETAAKIAEKYVSDLLGKSCTARLDDKVFGRYYFTVACDKKEYPVGIDKTDGKVVFYVISQ